MLFPSLKPLYIRFFFFSSRRRHTRCYRDWSSDVCSSDLRPDAVRILDFPHAAEYLAQVAQAGFGAGTAAATDWLAAQCHTLKHDSPGAVLAHIRAVRDQVAGRADHGERR